MDGVRAAPLSQRPVTFRYKTDLDPQGIPQSGLIAEEVDIGAPNWWRATTTARATRSSTKR